MSNKKAAPFLVGKWSFKFPGIGSGYLRRGWKGFIPLFFLPESEVSNCGDRFSFIVKHLNFKREREQY